MKNVLVFRMLVAVQVFFIKMRGAVFNSILQKVTHVLT